MKCEICGKPATYHTHLNINGRVSERHLCSNCAERMSGDVFENLRGSDFFGNAFDRLSDNEPITYGYLELDKSRKPAKSRLEVLKEQLKTAVQQERFEDAAVFKKQIDELERRDK